MPDVFMPRLSDTMQEGTVSVWIKNVGDRIEKGDVIAEIETDKATMELEAYEEGVLEKILVGAGGTAPIGEPIAVIGDGSGSGSGSTVRSGVPAGGSTPAAPAADAPPEPPVSAAVGTPATPSVPAAPSVPAPSVPAPSVPAPSVAAPSVPVADGAVVDLSRVKASPLARAIARDAGLDIATVHGSGPGGRIVRADVEAAVAALTSAPAAAAAAAAPATLAGTLPAGPDVEEIRLGNIRKITARRLVESKQQVPHFYLTRAIDAQELVTARASINAGLAAIAGDAAPVKVSVNDLVVKGCARALRAHPEMNVSFAGENLLRYRHINIGVAVALPDGLIVPVIRDADTLTLTQVSAQTKELAARARAGKLKPDEFSGGTFSISNLGMFGIDEFAAVINPPEAAILAVGAAKPQAVARDGQIVVRHVMKVTLSIDHRAVDGAAGAAFLATLAGLLENPLAALA